MDFFSVVLLLRGVPSDSTWYSALLSASCFLSSKNLLLSLATAIYFLVIFATGSPLSLPSLPASLPSFFLPPTHSFISFLPSISLPCFFFLIYFLLKDNCFTEFCYFLSNLNMNAMFNWRMNSRIYETK